MFDDQPSARDVRKQRQARLEEEAQHASSAPGKSSGDAATECSPSTPEQWAQVDSDLGFTVSRRASDGHGSSRYSLQ